VVRYAVVCLAALMATGASASEPAAPAGTPPLTDAQVIERTDLIIERLEDSRWHGEWYYHGWLALLGGFIAYNVVVVSQRDIDIDDSTRADAVANIIKSSAGVLDIMLMDDPFSRHGADELAALPADTPEQRRARLEQAEAILRRNAEQTDTRFLWYRHVAGVLVNLAHGLVVWLAWDDLQTGLISTALGIVGAEALIWTQPWEGLDDLETYEQRFGLVAKPDDAGTTLEWRISPAPGGLALTLRF